jgi:hypothetical protein
MKAKRATPDHVNFRCAGCNDVHTITDAQGRWTFNGDFERPTFSPSVLVMCGHYVSTFKAGEDNCWCTYDAEHPNEPSGFKCYRCHSFVVDGRIQFLGDCTHALANQTVDLPEWES